MKTIAICNQKGGTGKTTTALNLGVELARQGQRVLLVDHDPQGNLTSYCGYDPDSLTMSIANVYDAIIHEAPIPKINMLKFEECDLLPSNIELSGVELDLPSLGDHRHTALRTVLEPMQRDYDVALIDCSPSLGLLTLNALTAADSVIVPMVPQRLAVVGLEMMLQTVARVRQSINPRLHIDGVLITLHDANYRYPRALIGELEQSYGQYVRIFQARIPRTIRAAESTEAQSSIYAYDKKSTAATAYALLAREVTANVELENEAAQEL